MVSNSAKKRHDIQRLQIITQAMIRENEICRKKIAIGKLLMAHKHSRPSLMGSILHSTWGSQARSCDTSLLATCNSWPKSIFSSVIQAGVCWGMEKWAHHDTGFENISYKRNNPSTAIACWSLSQAKAYKSSVDTWKTHWHTSHGEVTKEWTASIIQTK